MPEGANAHVKRDAVMCVLVRARACVYMYVVCSFVLFLMSLLELPRGKAMKFV